MNDRLRPICIGPKSTIREAMQAITNGPKNDPPSPWGIALIMENETLLGIATDGDIRKAILSGKSLDDGIEDLMTREPLTILHDDAPDVILGRFHDALQERSVPESRFHHILTVDTSGKLVNIITPFELWKQSEVKIKTVSVIGLGYVGLTLALTLNEFGIRVNGIDVNEEVIGKLKAGTPHFYEKGLETLLKKHGEKLTHFSMKLSENSSDIFVICVGTPVDAKGKVNSQYLKDAVTDVGTVLKPHDLVILRSTVPLGTCRDIVIPILEEKSGLRAGSDFFIAFAPERTVEGKALEELKTLPQVIGGANKQSLDEASKFFRIFTHTIVGVDSLEEAEAVKLLNNTFRDVSFGFANEVAQALSGHGLNARNVIRAANEGYVRNPIPHPSPGVGGACLVKDPYLFTESSRQGGYEPKLPLAARAINESMIDFIVSKIDAFIEKYQKDPAKVRLFLMGIAFKGKPETSDIRHSTAVDILNELKKTYKDIRIFDPVAHKEDLETLGATVVESPEEGFKESDCTLVLNNHRSYADLDIFVLAGSMQSPSLLFDPWGSYRPEQLSELEGVYYAGL